MSGPVTFGVSTNIAFRCQTGLIVRAEPVGILQRGTHRLVSPTGQILATLRSNQVNLYALEGQVRTVCGVDEGQIEGVTSLLVTQALPPQAGLQFFVLSQAGAFRFQ